MFGNADYSPRSKDNDLLEPGTVATIVCNDKAMLIGPMTVFCTFNFQWTAIPRCQGIAVLKHVIVMLCTLILYQKYFICLFRNFYEIHKQQHKKIDQSKSQPQIQLMVVYLRQMAAS